MVQQELEQKLKAFPLIEANLLLPGGAGIAAICTNASAPGQVWNDIDPSVRDVVAVLGPLIVNRDGAERMIVNALVHPTVKFVILFSEESNTFAPSTNLLQALMHGYSAEKVGNYIVGGVGATPHYPSISEKIFSLFREEVIVLPAFAGRNPKSKQILADYLAWLAPRIPAPLHAMLVAMNSKDKIYFDALNKLLKLLPTLGVAEKRAVELNPQDFQHLQPPKETIAGTVPTVAVPFSVTADHGAVRVTLQAGTEAVTVRGEDPFIIGYTLMKHLGDQKSLLTPEQQLLLGAEMGRVQTEMLNELTFPSFVLPAALSNAVEIPLANRVQLVMDKQYYYRVGLRGKQVSCMCLAYDVCERVFELIAEHPGALLARLAQENRFEAYEMDILHRVDIGLQLGRAAIAASLGYAFMQDFSAIFKINTTHLPSLIIDGDSFLDVHKGILRGLYTQGLTSEHADSWKGTARTGSVLAIYRQADTALQELPLLYKQGDQDTRTMRANYRNELLRFDHDGNYSYGERTRSFFGLDQLPAAGEALKRDPSRAVLVQRFDPSQDMSKHVDPETGKAEYTHDPCLTHDIFFALDGKLHSFHIARAHNAVNAYPENVFGLFDAYVQTVREKTGLAGGDLYMLSNRANILLLTEEQRTKKILAEPSKPVGDLDTRSGPYRCTDTCPAEGAGGVAYFHAPLTTLSAAPAHPFLSRLTSYQGVDTVAKAVQYLVERGGMHNNPLLSTYYAGKDDAQGEHLAFFQANAYGGKLYATAVFMNRSASAFAEDQALINYLATRFAQALSVELGDARYFYVAYRP